MVKRITVWISLLLLTVAGWAASSRDFRPYLFELGLEGGTGYYVGDASPHIFMNPRWTAGVQARYKPHPRWAVALYGQYQQFFVPSVWLKPDVRTEAVSQYMVGVDATAEYHFFRFGSTRTYDNRVKAYTPYIFAGIGMGVGPNILTGYVPVGLGFKWKVSQHVGMNLRWQHNIYFTDNIEGVPELDDPYGLKLNGTNWFNCDILSQLTFGIVVEFGQLKKVCKFCEL